MDTAGPHPVRLILRTTDRLFAAGIQAFSEGDEMSSDRRRAPTVTVIDAHTCDVATLLGDGLDTDTTIIVTSADAALEPLRSFLGREVGAVLASGFSRPEFHAALQTVAVGGLYVHKAFIPAMRFAVRTGSSVPFTAREKQVFAALCRAWSNAEIADTLGVSPRTVRFHVSNILRKLGMTRRNQIIATYR